MRKIVINIRHGGFSVSDIAVKKMRELGCETAINETLLGENYKDTGEVSKYSNNSRNFERDCPILVKVVEEMGEKADGGYAKLKIIEIPNDVKWIIEEYDGKEWISEEHRSWS